MTIVKAIKIAFIFIKHGINPFIPVGKIMGKMKERLSEKEKKWIIDNASGYPKEYFQKSFEMQ